MRLLLGSLQKALDVGAAMRRGEEVDVVFYRVFSVLEPGIPNGKIAISLRLGQFTVLV
jgi:hypothetical protein